MFDFLSLKIMNKRLLIIILLTFTLLATVFIAYLAIFLEQSKFDHKFVARVKTSTATILWGSVIISNGILACVLLHCMDMRRPYDFLLILMAIFEMVTVSFTFCLYIPLLWYHVSWNSQEVSVKIMKASVCLYALSFGSVTFSTYCPVIALSLELYRNLMKIRGNISTRASLTPVVITSLVSFGTAFTAYVGRNEKEWLFAFTETVAYIIPTAATLALLVLLKLKSCSHQEPQGNSPNTTFQYNVFAAFSIAFIVLYAPTSIGHLVFMHAVEEDVVMQHYGKFSIISSGLIMLKFLLNLPLLLAFDSYFRQGYCKFLINCFPCCKCYLVKITKVDDTRVHYSSKQEEGNNEEAVLIIEED